jgi:hypothetical protein
MKVSNVSIIKTDSVESAIKASIIEFYNEKHVIELNDSLVVDGNVGTCIEVDEGTHTTRTSTTLFIVTVITGGMYRVEHCFDFDIAYKS